VDSAATIPDSRADTQFITWADHADSGTGGAGGDRYRSGRARMKSALPETPPPPRTALPAAQLALEAYWHVGRHLRVYALQILVLSVVSWLFQVATSIVVSLIPHASLAAATGMQQLVFVVTIVTVLLLGGTAIFIDCMRAVVLGVTPAVGHALRLRPGETRVLRAVCIYWLIVHLVPTVIVQLSYVADPLGLDWVPRLPAPANFVFYWGWVLATAPLVVMSLPIVLFEGAAAPVAQGRQRLDGNGGRMFLASALAFAPLAAVEVGAYLVRTAGPFDNDPALYWLFEFVLMNLLQTATSFATILVMSALVASAYLRLSPRIESVYRVFD